MTSTPDEVYDRMTSTLEPEPELEHFLLVYDG
jgi:hypothetical protein